jgi:hypothetical protein
MSDDRAEDINSLYDILKRSGYAVGIISERRLYVAYPVQPTNGLMVALEHDGCYFHDDMRKPINSFDLVGSGFDLLSAPIVSEIVEALRQRAQAEPIFGDADVRLIGEVKHD